MTIMPRLGDHTWDALVAALAREPDGDVRFAGGPASILRIRRLHPEMKAANESALHSKSSGFGTISQNLLGRMMISVTSAVARSFNAVITMLARGIGPHVRAGTQTGRRVY
jgi:hypothetical protein